jgi:hypothetical protein
MGRGSPRRNNVKTFSNRTTEMQLDYNSAKNLEALGRQADFSPPRLSPKTKTRPDIIIKKNRTVGR